MTVAEIENRVREFVTSSFLGDGAPPPARDEDLFALLDSLQVLRTVVWIEEQFGVKVTDGELTADNLSTIARMSAYIGARTGAAS